jgi:hypothetical protein
MNIPNNAVKKALGDPATAAWWTFRRVKSYPYLACRSLNQWYHSKTRKAGDLDIMDESWDILLILDACRYDYFEDINTIEGHLEKRQSPGTMSLEFMEETYFGGEFHDTVYITANTFASEIPEGTFHKLINLVEDGWDEELKTVPPKEMVSATENALVEYPNKRIIAHFMQPHTPFLSEYGQEISEKLYYCRDQWTKGKNKREHVQKAYRENLQLILDSIQPLVEEIENDLVITSDHGELLGERLSPIPIQGWEHPRSLYHDSLVDVPWLRVDGKSRQTIEEPPGFRAKLDSDTVEERLSDLGYQ